jgi:5-methylcytosine-specific restriction enzyme subunit McrC
MAEDTITLATYTPSTPQELSGDDVAFVSERLHKRVTIARDLEQERYVLNPQQHVGLVRLPSGRLLRSSPRIPTDNVFRMLAMTSEYPAVLPDATGLGELDAMLEFIAAHFATQLEHLIEQGLYRTYVETEDNLPVVRGRIQIAEDIRHNFVQRHRTYCRFTELTWDIPENQVLRHVVGLLSGWPFSRDLSVRLYQLDRTMDEVSRRVARPDDFDRFNYTRLNRTYEPVHRLARLLLQDMSLSEQDGEYEFVSFLLDMNELFERFVAKVFEAEWPTGLGTVHTQRQAALGSRRSLGGVARRWGRIKPDIAVTRGRDMVAVLDTKYKKTPAGMVHNPDVYQVLAYCVAEATDRGALIYPSWEFSEDDEIEIRNSNIAIRRFAIDLSVPADDLIVEARDLVNRVASWTQESSSPVVAVGA